MEEESDIIVFEHYATPSSSPTAFRVRRQCAVEASDFVKQQLHLLEAGQDGGPAVVQFVASLWGQDEDTQHSLGAGTCHAYFQLIQHEEEFQRLVGCKAELRAARTKRVAFESENSEALDEKMQPYIAYHRSMFRNEGELIVEIGALEDLFQDKGVDFSSLLDVVVLAYALQGSRLLSLCLDYMAFAASNFVSSTSLQWQMLPPEHARRNKW
eukprot:g4055.t1